MMDAMCRLCALVAVIYSEVLVPDGEKAEYRRDGKDGGVRLTFGEPEPLNGLLKEPVIYISTDAVDFSWRSVCHDQLLAAYPVYALVYYPREDEKSALLAGDFVERLAAELTAEDRWFGNIPGFIEQPSADYLGFDKSTNCHKWALYFEYRRLPVPPHVPFPGDVLLRTVKINWRRDIQDTWVFDVTQFVGAGRRRLVLGRRNETCRGWSTARSTRCRRTTPPSSTTRRRHCPPGWPSTPPHGD